MERNSVRAMERQKRLKRDRGIAGFTMAELLIVIAIITVLAGVSFIGVQRYQKSMKQIEYDTIAKEIFVAAQNHLALAKSDNYNQTEDEAVNFGTPGNADADADNSDIYYIYSHASTGTVLEQILPFGSIDETVRTGYYIIRYQPKAARVLDVFYWTDDSRYRLTINPSSNYRTLVNNYRSDAHKSYDSRGKGVLGWFGDEEAVETGDFIQPPTIEVKNAERLTVTVTDMNISDISDSGFLLKLLVSGETSGAKVAIPISLESSNRVTGTYPNYTIILDDITYYDAMNQMHFANLSRYYEPGFQYLQNNGSDIPFIPGENITIQAVAYSNTKLTSVSYSAERRTNSLFADVSVDPATKKADTVYIDNIRHLENLNDIVSGVGYGDPFFNNAISAVQTADLDWSQFIEKVREEKSVAADSAVNISDPEGNITKDNCYWPVTTSYSLKYNGQSAFVTTEEKEEEGIPTLVSTTTTLNHSIKGIVVDNIVVDNTEDVDIAAISAGGLFGSLTGSEIRNLELIDFNIKLNTGAAGALAGNLSASTVTNVIAYNTEDYEKSDLLASDKTTVSSKGNVGGLIGKIDSKTDLIKCAAALVVRSEDGNAGGLVGAVGAGTECIVTGCYSGGHTINDTRTGSDAVVYDPAKPNVKASGTGNVAGGLIGDAGAAAISNSYSTCSVEGATAGGLVGTATGDITNCYATGLVTGTTVEGAFAGTTVEGAFAGTYSTGTLSGNHYFEIINELLPVTGDGYTYLKPVGKYFEAGDLVDDIDLKGKVDAIDETAATYNEFTFDSSDVHYAWQKAVPYNATLTKYYGGDDGALYVLRTVKQLDAEVEDTDFVSTHYGDWPAPEIFVFNTKASGS